MRDRTTDRDRAELKRREYDVAQESDRFWSFREKGGESIDTFEIGALFTR